MGIEAKARGLHSANAGQVKSVNACSLATISSRVGESKVLRHGERACPLGCTSARSRLGPPTTSCTLLPFFDILEPQSDW